MRELTFRGYLSQYVKQLSLTNTTSLSVLIPEAEQKNPRLREPLALYVLYNGKQKTFFRYNAASPGLELHKAYLTDYTPEQMTALLSADSPLLPAAYRKVWHSYRSRKNRLQADDHTKELMRSKILRLQKAKQITNYRIYTDLKLNPGNTNAWLKHGSHEKISLNNARSILRYMEDPRPTA